MYRIMDSATCAYMSRDFSHGHGKAAGIGRPDGSGEGKGYNHAGSAHCDGRGDSSDSLNSTCNTCPDDVGYGNGAFGCSPKPL